MDGYDLQQYETLCSRCTDHEMYVVYKGKTIIILKSENERVGIFDNVNDASMFIYGYDVGYSKGRLDGFKRSRDYD